MKSDNTYSEYNKAKSIAKSLINRVGDKDHNDQTIKEWISDNKYSYSLCEKLSKDENVQQALFELSDIDKIKENAIKKILVDAKKHERRIGKNRILKYTISSCAAALAVICFLLYSNSSEIEITAKNIIAQKQESANNNAPILILSDGQQINLRDQNEKLIDNKIVINENNKAIEYLVRESNTTQESFNTLITKNAQTYSVILSDGTVVILNANSEIKYPVTFQNDCRKVELKGEAYFKVKDGTTPFIVSAKCVNIQVYGTEFNVNSYSDNQVYTVLIEGSVGVHIDGCPEMRLTPNQLSIINSETGSSIIKTVDVDNYLSWLNNNFIYDDRNFYDMINDISAWYGIEFEYDKKVFSDVIINATFSRSVPIEKVLNSISRILNINFIKLTDTTYEIK